MEEALYACRFVHFAAAMAAFGTTAFWSYAAVPERAEFEAWVRPTLVVAATAALISALVLIPCQSAAMAGSAAAAFDPDTLFAVLSDTRFGRLWSWRLLAALALLLACRAPSGRKTVVLLLSSLLLASLAWIGHTAMTPGLAGIAREFNQSAHLIAAGLWLGGLVPLGWLLRRARGARDDAALARTRDVIRRFSQMGYAAVAAVALTGAVNTGLLVGGFEAMRSTLYGRLLALKISLFLLMAAVALVNRFRCAPRISRDPGALVAFGRNVVLEQALGLAILAIVSVLGTLPPAIYAAD